MRVCPSAGLAGADESNRGETAMEVNWVRAFITTSGYLFIIIFQVTLG